MAAPYSSPTSETEMPNVPLATSPQASGRFETCTLRDALPDLPFCPTYAHQVGQSLFACSSLCVILRCSLHTSFALVKAQPLPDQVERVFMTAFDCV